MEQKAAPVVAGVVDPVGVVEVVLGVVDVIFEVVVLLAWFGSGMAAARAVPRNRTC